jgi:cytochrome c-type biogenesis protein CcmE
MKYGKKVKLRFLFLVLILFSVILSAFLILQSLKDNVIYFQSPSEIKSLTEINKKKIRIGGMVKEKSINIDSDEVKFIITDFKNEINVIYSGAIPNLFSEGKGVVAEGFLKDRNYFLATKILAKHDENYMPPEVKEAIGVK